MKNDFLKLETELTVNELTDLLISESDFFGFKVTGQEISELMIEVFGVKKELTIQEILKNAYCYVKNPILERELIYVITKKIVIKGGLKMKEIETLEQLASKLNTNNTWIRNALKQLMQKVYEIETDDEIYAEVDKDLYGMGLFVVLGKKDIQIWSGSDWVDFDTKKYFYEVGHIQTIRHILKNFPATIEKLKVKIKKENDEIEKLKTLFNF